ncbi:MAG: hypothetical protein PVI30_26665 [Myxococcales bacterium]|jgi:hypothetical protein
MSGFFRIGRLAVLSLSVILVAGCQEGDGGASDDGRMIEWSGLRSGPGLEPPESPGGPGLEPPTTSDGTGTSGGGSAPSGSGNFGNGGSGYPSGAAGAGGAGGAMGGDTGTSAPDDTASEGPGCVLPDECECDVAPRCVDGVGVCECPLSCEPGTAADPAGYDAIPTDIDAILEASCRGCHEGGVAGAPVLFSELLSLQEMSERYDPTMTIAEAAAARLQDPLQPMPPLPWLITDADRQTLQAWLQAGAPSAAAWCSPEPPEEEMPEMPADEMPVDAGVP